MTEDTAGTAIGTACASKTSSDRSGTVIQQPGCLHATQPSGATPTSDPSLLPAHGPERSAGPGASPRGAPQATPPHRRLPPTRSPIHSLWKPHSAPPPPHTATSATQTPAGCSAFVPTWKLPPDQVPGAVWRSTTACHVRSPQPGATGQADAAAPRPGLDQVGRAWLPRMFGARSTPLPDAQRNLPPASPLQQPQPGAAHAVERTTLLSMVHSSGRQAAQALAAGAHEGAHSAPGSAATSPRAVSELPRPGASAHTGDGGAHAVMPGPPAASKTKHDSATRAFPALQAELHVGQQAPEAHLDSACLPAADTAPVNTVEGGLMGTTGSAHTNPAPDRTCRAASGPLDPPSCAFDSPGAVASSGSPADVECEAEHEAKLAHAVCLTTASGGTAAGEAAQQDMKSTTSHGAGSPLLPESAPAPAMAPRIGQLDIPWGADWVLGVMNQLRADVSTGPAHSGAERCPALADVASMGALGANQPEPLQPGAAVDTTGMAEVKDEVDEEQEGSPPGSREGEAGQAHGGTSFPPACHSAPSQAATGNHGESDPCACVLEEPCGDNTSPSQGKGLAHQRVLQPAGRPVAGLLGSPDCAPSRAVDHPTDVGDDNDDATAGHAMARSLREAVTPQSSSGVPCGSSDGSGGDAAPSLSSGHEVQVVEQAARGHDDASRTSTSVPDPGPVAATSRAHQKHELIGLTGSVCEEGQGAGQRMSGRLPATTTAHGMDAPGPNGGLPTPETAAPSVPDVSAGGGGPCCAAAAQEVQGLRAPPGAMDVDLLPLGHPLRVQARRRPDPAGSSPALKAPYSWDRLGAAVAAGLQLSVGQVAELLRLGHEQRAETSVAVVRPAARDVHGPVQHARGRVPSSGRLTKVERRPPPSRQAQRLPDLKQPRPIAASHTATPGCEQGAPGAYRKRAAAPGVASAPRGAKRRAIVESAESPGRHVAQSRPLDGRLRSVHSAQQQPISSTTLAPSHPAAAGMQHSRPARHPAAAPAAPGARPTNPPAPSTAPAKLCYATLNTVRTIRVLARALIELACASESEAVDLDTLSDILLPRFTAAALHDPPASVQCATAEASAVTSISLGPGPPPPPPLPALCGLPAALGGSPARSSRQDLAKNVVGGAASTVTPPSVSTSALPRPVQGGGSARLAAEAPMCSTGTAAVCLPSPALGGEPPSSLAAAQPDGLLAPDGDVVALAWGLPNPAVVQAARDAQARCAEVFASLGLCKAKGTDSEVHSGHDSPHAAPKPTPAPAPSGRRAEHAGVPSPRCVAARGVVVCAATDHGASPGPQASPGAPQPPLHAAPPRFVNSRLEACPADFMAVAQAALPGWEGDVAQLDDAGRHQLLCLVYAFTHDEPLLLPHMLGAEDGPPSGSLPQLSPSPTVIPGAPSSSPQQPCPTLPLLHPDPSGPAPSTTATRSTPGHEASAVPPNARLPPVTLQPGPVVDVTQRVQTVELQAAAVRGSGGGAAARGSSGPPMRLMPGWGPTPASGSLAGSISLAPPVSAYPHQMVVPHGALQASDVRAFHQLSHPPSAQRVPGQSASPRSALLTIFDGLMTADG